MGKVFLRESAVFSASHALKSGSKDGIKQTIQRGTKQVFRSVAKEGTKIVINNVVYSQAAKRSAKNLAQFVFQEAAEEGAKNSFTKITAQHALVLTTANSLASATRVFVNATVKDDD